MRIALRYRDPLDEIWLNAAARIGFTVARTDGAYASTDGRGNIFVGVAEALDADDCLAQMILHELCHALVEGEGAWTKVDWGLDNTSDRDTVREHACLRLQAALLWPHGLRHVLAPTTEYREYYDRLSADPLAADADAAVIPARVALRRAGRRPFAPHLDDALAATAVIARVVPASPESLWREVEPPAPRHATGLPMPPAGAGETCGGCAWHQVSRGGRCRQATGVRVNADSPACAHWEPAAIDCQMCAACCRDAYDSVTVGARERVVRRHPALVVWRDSYAELARAGDRCAALAGDNHYACTIYDDRPRTCRDFTRLGQHCLEARRKVGLSR